MICRQRAFGSEAGGGNAWQGEQAVSRLAGASSAPPRRPRRVATAAAAMEPKSIAWESFAAARW